MHRQCQDFWHHGRSNICTVVVATSAMWSWHICIVVMPHDVVDIEYYMYHATMYKYCALILNNITTCTHVGLYVHPSSLPY